jgi:hypothetical protein
MNWVGVIMGLVGPAVRRALISLGIGLVTYVGVDAAVTSILSGAKAAWAASAYGDAATLVAMAGGNTALSVIAGGIVGRVSMMVLKRFQVLGGSH